MLYFIWYGIHGPAKRMGLQSAMRKDGFLMPTTLSIGALTAEPGQKVRGFLPVPGTPVQMPTTLINGAKDGRRVVITGGTHGGEYPGVETAIRLAAQLDPAAVSGQIIVVHPVNVPAFFARMQYIGPYDGKNLNRCYPGRATGTVSERIAYYVMNELMMGSDFYMDLHGGDLHEWLTPFVLYPMTGTEEVARISREAASCLGLPYVVGSWGTNGTIGAAAVAGVPGFLCEIGCRGLWNEAEVKQYMDGVNNVLRHLSVLPGVAANLGSCVYMERMTGVNAGVTGCWYPCVEPDEQVEAGQKLGEIRDLFGEVLETYIAPKNGVVLYVISSLAVEAGDPIAAVG